MKLLVGLGNPGKQYEKTRHNAGFDFLDSLSISDNEYKFEKKFNSLVKKVCCKGMELLIAKPLSFMNNSGECVKKICDYYKINSEDILVIHDDMDIQLGKIKFKQSGSSAGHNGIKSIMSQLNTENFKRLRIGISNESENKIDYVLGRFSDEEQLLLEKIYLNSDLIIEDYLSLNFSEVMCKYNR